MAKVVDIRAAKPAAQIAAIAPPSLAAIVAGHGAGADIVGLVELLRQSLGETRRIASEILALAPCDLRLRTFETKLRRFLGEAALFGP
jgi:hypothetical protein